MKNGIDTDFLVAVEVIDHPFHASAWAVFQKILATGDEFALVPQVLSEFIHVATDSRRLINPLSMPQAIRRAENWWQAEETFRVLPTTESIQTGLIWMQEHHLGRKRVLDTMLAASYFHSGIRRLITNNKSDYVVFNCFDILEYYSSN